MGSGVSALVGMQPVLTAVWLSAAAARVTRQWVGCWPGFAGLLLVVSHKLGACGRQRRDPCRVSTWPWVVLRPAVHHTGTLYQKRFGPPLRCPHGQCDPADAALLVTLPLAALESGSPGTPSDRRHGLVRAGAHAGRQLAAVPADPAARPPR